MTTLNEAREAVYTKFNTTWSVGPITVFTFDNEDFTEPEGDPPDPWVRLVVRHTSRLQSTLGKKTSRKFRTTASVFVQVYTAANIGVDLADSLAKQASDIFEGESFSGLDFGAAVPSETGPDGKWYQFVVEIPFDYDETK